MTDENKDSTPAEPVEVSPDPTKAAAPIEEILGAPEEPIENGGGK